MLRFALREIADRFAGWEQFVENIDQRVEALQRASAAIRITFAGQISVDVVCTEMRNTARCQWDTTCVVAEMGRRTLRLRGVRRYFDFENGSVMRWDAAQRDGCGLRVASEFRSTDVRQFGPN